VHKHNKMAKLTFISKITDAHEASKLFLSTQPAGVQYAFQQDHHTVTKNNDVVTVETWDHKDNPAKAENSK